ncbi:hypothetical protein HK102_007113, partial [Quaeritorhiza haematococci]
MPGPYPTPSGEPTQVPKMPGIQAEMKTQPATTQLPEFGTGSGTKASAQGIVGLEEYKAAGKLSGKTAVITGGDSGIGRSIAVMMAMEGADIGIIYLPEEQVDANETAKMVMQNGRKCVLIAKDISVEQNCKEIVDEIASKFGKIDILVNNAARQSITEKLEDLPSQQLEETFRVNVFGMFYLTKYALPYIPDGGAIVNSTSVTAYKGSPHLLDYAATKGAIVAFTRSLAKQLAPRKIRVNGVAAGPVWTPLQPASRPEENLKK